MKIPLGKIQSSKNKTEETKIVSPVTPFSETESKQIEENEEFVTLDDGTTISALEYERILKELDKENKALSESDKRKMAILRINTPWLLKYVTDQKYKVPLVQAFKIYTRAKDLGILDKLKDLAPALRDPLITTREGRKIILNDEYRDLLEKIVSKQYTTERAISEVKQREALKRGGKVKKSSKPRAKDEEEDEGEEIETIDREDSESEEYDLVGEWQRANEEEEAKQQLTPQFNGNTQVVTQSQKEFLQELDRLGSYARIPIQIVNTFNEKGFFEIPERSIIARIGVRLYVINEDALRDLEQGKSERWKELVNLLSKADLIVPDENGIYTVMWRLLCKCQ